MRISIALLWLVGAVTPAHAQEGSGYPATLEAMRRHFPVNHAELTSSLKGKSAADGRKLVHQGVYRFIHARSDNILSAPGATLVALETRQAQLLRKLQAKDAKICASVGDRGLFSPEALPATPLDGLDDYGAALVEAARTKAAPNPAPSPSRDDFLLWLAEVEKIEPDVPVRKMLADRDFRNQSTPNHLCRGAAAMHEAVSRLPHPQAERVATSLLRSSLAPAAPQD